MPPDRHSKQSNFGADGVKGGSQILAPNVCKKKMSLNLDAQRSREHTTSDKRDTEGAGGFSSQFLLLLTSITVSKMKITRLDCYVFDVKSTSYLQENHSLLPLSLGGSESPKLSSLSPLMSQVRMINWIHYQSMFRNQYLIIVIKKQIQWTYHSKKKYKDMSRSRRDTSS